MRTAQDQSSQGSFDHKAGSGEGNVHEKARALIS